MRLGRLSSAIPLLFSLVRTRQEVRINRLSDCAVQAVAQRLTEEKYRLKRYEQSLFPAVGRMLELEKKRMETLALRIKCKTRNCCYDAVTALRFVTERWCAMPRN